MKKLRTKFLVFILLPVLAIMTLAGVISYLNASEIMSQQLEKLSALSLRQAVDEIDSSFGIGIQAVRILALQEGITNFSENQVKTFFEDMKAKVPLGGGEFPVECIFLAFPDGRFVTSLDLSEVPKNYEPRLQRWFESALDTDETIVSSPALSPFSSRLVVTVAQKISDKKGSVEAVLGYNVPLDAFRGKMPDIKILETVKGTVFSIFMRDGRYIIHSDDEKIGRKLGESADDLPVRMRQALQEGKTSWRSLGKARGSRWLGEFQKSRYGDLYVSLEIPLVAGMWPIIRLGWTYLILGFAASVILSVILIKMAHKIARPVSMLSEAAVRLSRGDYGNRLPVVTKDELGHLTETFNNMTDGLRQRDFIRGTFGRYVTTEVVDQLLESKDGLRLGGENREISIVMSDLRGFTAHTAHMPPEKVLFFLNRYLGKMMEILLDHRAIVDEIVGDGILAFFGAPVPMEDHPTRAVACAVQMQAAMEHISAMNEAEGFPRLEMGIGVNTGNVVVGNIGSERRTKYGVVGSEVNFTGRIESYTVGGQILISQSTYERVKDIVKVRDIIHVEMKGMQGRVGLYDVRGIGGAYNIVLPDQMDTPTPVRKKIRVRVRRVDEKAVAQEEKRAWITHLSHTAAVVASEEQVQAYEEIRMDFPDHELGTADGEAYAKVLSVATKDRLYEASVRFTFVSPGIRSLFRREISQG